MTLMRVRPSSSTVTSWWVMNPSISTDTSSPLGWVTICTRLKGSRRPSESSG